LQDGKTLPKGPVVISPDGLFPSLYREGQELLMRAIKVDFYIYAYLTCIILSYLLMPVIKRAPHEFKIACLEVISLTQILISLMST